MGGGSKREGWVGGKGWEGRGEWEAAFLLASALRCEDKEPLTWLSRLILGLPPLKRES